MTGRPAAERADNHAIAAAQRRAEDQYAESPVGMHAAAADLRRHAVHMMDSNDRATMIRLAAAYERRADGAIRRLKRA